MCYRELQQQTTLQKHDSFIITTLHLSYSVTQYEFFLGNINNSKAYATVNDSEIILVLEAAKDIEPVSHVQTVVSGE